MTSPYEFSPVGNVHDRSQIIDLGAYWRDIHMEYVAGDLIYRGCHFLHNASTADTNWEIWKYTLVGTDYTRIEGPIRGSWDGRAALGWA